MAVRARTRVKVDNLDLSRTSTETVVGRGSDQGGGALLARRRAEVSEGGAMGKDESALWSSRGLERQDGGGNGCTPVADCAQVDVVKEVHAQAVVE